ncbi:MAG TPA: hypothetical protein VN783_07005 [Thermoanaerobaculia bacterium]|nr:hypothetical protein [Thermoanaerobaculia bacterium]
MPRPPRAAAEAWSAFADRRLWFDAGLAALDLAGVELARGRTAEVKILASASAQVFRNQALPQDLLAAIRLFWEAAVKESASAARAQELAGALHGTRQP